MKKVILTGASGFLGKHFADKLSKENVRVYAIVRRANRDISFLSDLYGVIPVQCDLSDLGRLPELMGDRDVDAFYHFAWAGTSGNDRADYRLQLKNVEYSCDAVKVANKMGCKKFIFAGSVMEFESMGHVMQDGARPIQTNIYSIAKQTAHFMSKTVAASLNIDFITAIISNVYGEGEYSNRLVNTSLRKFLLREKNLFSDGKQLYDFIYIKDAVEAFYLIGKGGKPFSDYYIGNCEPRPLYEFLMIMRDCVDPNIKLGLGELPSNGQSLTYREFDTYKLRKEFGFAPKFSFEQGIERTLQWLKKEC